MTGNNIISYDAKRYKNWEKMHDGVKWFDTAACWQASQVGLANAAQFSGIWPSGVNGWWTNTTAPTQTNHDEYGRPTRTAHTFVLDPATRDAYDTDLTVTGTYQISDKDSYKNYLKDVIELYEDCDIDC